MATDGDIVRLKTEMENVNQHLDSLEETVKTNHAEIKTEIQGIRTDSMSRHEAYTASISTVKETFATKVELHEVKTEFETALTQALAPIRKIGWAVMGLMFTILSGLVVTVVGGLTLYLITRN